MSLGLCFDCPTGYWLRKVSPVTLKSLFKSLVEAEDDIVAKKRHHQEERLSQGWLGKCDCPLCDRVESTQTSR